MLVILGYIVGFTVLWQMVPLPPSHAAAPSYFRTVAHPRFSSSSATEVPQDRSARGLHPHVPHERTLATPRTRGLPAPAALLMFFGVVACARACACACVGRWVTQWAAANEGPHAPGCREHRLLPPEQHLHQRVRYTLRRRSFASIHDATRSHTHTHTHTHTHFACRFPNHECLYWDEDLVVYLLPSSCSHARAAPDSFMT